MKKELMGLVYKQLDIFLDACMAKDERAELVLDESLTNIKKLFDDKELDKGLDDFKTEFENNLTSIEKITLDHIRTAEEITTLDDVRQYIAKADTDAIGAYTKFIDDIKTYIILYIKAV